MPKARTVLAIDTSCDETSVAVTRGVTILSNVIASQAQLHVQYGGVFPTVAKQAHRENLEPTIAMALRRAQLDWSDIDVIAVTQGPGLAPALEVGITKAKELAHLHHIPLLPINHLEGHLLSPLAQPHSKIPQPEITPSGPVLGLIISGGHTDFVAITGLGKYERLGWTIDDAAGEALDKVGRMLDLGYPAGPVIEEFARLGNAAAFEFPLPMTTSGDFNVSFSGLKTFARNKIEDLQTTQPLSKGQVYDFSASFQKAVFRAICYKVEKILKAHPAKFSEVWLGGGVAANMKLRQTLRQTLKPYHLKLRVPYSKKLCGDNAAMIGVVASFKPLLHNDTFERQPRMPLGTTS